MSQSHSIFRAFTLAALTTLFAAFATQTSTAQTELYVFSSQHCGPCQQLKPAIQWLAQQNYPIRAIDTDMHPALTQKFRVTQIPCLVMVKDGQELFRQVGGNEQIVRQMFSRAGITSVSSRLHDSECCKRPCPFAPFDYSPCPSQCAPCSRGCVRQKPD